MGSCWHRVESGRCGKDVYHSGLCENHYAFRYPTTYARFQRETKCDLCLGTGRNPNPETQLMETCTKCGGRGIYDPRHQGGQ